MIFTIDSKKLEKSGSSIPEYLVLLLTKYCQDIPKLLEELKQKEMIQTCVYGYDILSPKADKFVADMMVYNDKKIPDYDYITALARKMCQLFPAGLKPGTAISWRGNSRDIANRLMKFFAQYSTYTAEEVLDATKRYVDSFNGNYSYMRVLKYFIMKQETVADEYGNASVETISQLADFIENKENGGQQNNMTGELK
jgi:hypothetical protein